MGDRAYDRVDYAQPKDEPRLRVLVGDDGGSDLRGDDPSDAQKARQRSIMRSSQTPSKRRSLAIFLRSRSTFSASRLDRSAFHLALLMAASNSSSGSSSVAWATFSITARTKPAVQPL